MAEVISDASPAALRASTPEHVYHGAEKGEALSSGRDPSFSLCSSAASRVMSGSMSYSHRCPWSLLPSAADSAYRTRLSLGLGVMPGILPRLAMGLPSTSCRSAVKSSGRASLIWLPTAKTSTGAPSSRK